MDENRVRPMPEHVNENDGKNDESRPTVRSIISDYGERTTIHGFLYLIRGGSFVRQLIWFCFISCSFAYFTLNGIRLFTNFFKYPTLTKYEIVTQKKMLFPAITVCNYNPIRKSKQESILNYLYNNLKLNVSLSNFRQSVANGSDNYAALNHTNNVERIYQSFGHSMDEDGMFVSCKWKGKSCSGKYFRSSAQSMGLCHTFNSGMTNTV